LVQFSATVLKIMQVYGFSTSSPKWNIFTVSRDAEMRLSVIFHCNTSHVNSMTCLQVTGSHSNKMAVAFWKC